MRGQTIPPLAAVVLALVSSPLWAEPTHDWSKSFAFPSSAHATSVARDDSGNTLVTGDFEGTVDFGGGQLTSAGTRDIFLAKFDAEGNHLWSHGFGQYDYDTGTSVAVDGPGNVIITGRFRYGVDFGGGVLTAAGNADIFVAKFDPDGNHLWSRRFGDSSNQYGVAVAADATGNIALTGYFNSTVDFGGGPLTSGVQIDIYVAEFDPDGNHLWSRSAGDDTFQRSNSVAIDGSGNVIIVGDFSGSIDLGDGPFTSAGGDDIFLAKYDGEGNPLWSRQFGGAEYQRGHAVAVDGSDNIVLTGYYYGTVDFGDGALTSVDAADAYLASFDPDGNVAWSKGFAGGSDQIGSSVAVDASGNIAITGFFEETVDFGGGTLTSEGPHELFIASFDASGVHRSSRCFASFEYQFGSSVATGASGSVVFTGGFTGTVDVGSGPITAGLNSEGLVAELDDDGNPVWSRRLGQPTGLGYGISLAVDSSRNVVITGSCQGTVDFGGGPFTGAVDDDVFVAKFNEHGQALWSRRFGDAGAQYGYAVATDGFDDVILTGTFDGSLDFGGGSLTSSGTDIYLAKLDANGNHLWSRRFGDAGRQNSGSVATAPSGSVVIVGPLEGSVDFGGGPLTAPTGRAIFLASFDAAGNHLWSKSFGDGAQPVLAVDVDAAGNVMITGSFFGSVDFGGGPLTSAGNADIFLASFDASGNHRWSRRYGDAAAQYATAVATFGAGNVVVTGKFQGSVDFGGGPFDTVAWDDIFVASFDADGNHLWSQGFGSSFYEEGTAVDVDTSGNVILTGSMAGAVDFGGGLLAGTGAGSVFLAAFDAAGSHLWSQRYEGLYEQYPTSVAADGSGHITLLGHNNSYVDFGGGRLGGNIFLAHFGDGMVPVRFATFDASPRQGSVEIRWEVWSDDAQERFTLYRRDASRAQPIVVAEGNLRQSPPGYVDDGVTPGKTYEYQLVIHTQAGQDTRSPTVTVTVPARGATLAQNNPNPFNPKTTIEYRLAERSAPVLSIFDAQGRRVARLDQGQREAGAYWVDWDGHDDHGRELASGVYFYRLDGVKGVEARKMLLLR